MFGVVGCLFKRSAHSAGPFSDNFSLNMVIGITSIMITMIFIVIASVIVIIINSFVSIMIMAMLKATAT